MAVAYRPPPVPEGSLYVQLREACLAQDEAAVEVAAFEVHLGVDARRVAPERGVDQARAVEEFLPGNRGKRRERRDRPRHALGAIVLCQPAAARRGPGRGLEARQELVAGRHQRLEAGEPQHGRKRPELGDRQRAAPLVSGDEGGERLEPRLHLRRVERAVGDEVDPRQTAVLRLGEARQLPVEASRHVPAHFADRAADDVQVVGDPFRGLGGLGRRLGRPPAHMHEPLGQRLALRKDPQRGGRSGLDPVMPLQLPGRPPRGIVSARAFHSAQVRPRMGFPLAVAAAIVATDGALPQASGRTIRIGLPRWVTRNSATLPIAWSA